MRPAPGPSPGGGPPAFVTRMSGCGHAASAAARPSGVVMSQATAVTDRWGTAAYGALNGVLTAPALLAAAVAPFVGAVLAGVLGSYTAAFLALAGVAGVAALLMLRAAPPTTG